MLIVVMGVIHVCALRFAYLEKFSLDFQARRLHVILVNLLHSDSSLVVYGLLQSLSMFTYSAKI